MLGSNWVVTSGKPPFLGRQLFRPLIGNGCCKPAFLGHPCKQKIKSARLRFNKMSLIKYPHISNERLNTSGRTDLAKAL